jgi:hypothetical protein
MIISVHAQLDKCSTADAGGAPEPALKEGVAVMDEAADIVCRVLFSTSLFFSILGHPNRLSAIGTYSARTCLEPKFGRITHAQEDHIACEPPRSQPKASIYFHKI